VKTITLEEIYADPHVLDPLLAAGEPVEIMELGRTKAKLIPSKEAPPRPSKPFDIEAHRTWFLQTWGPDALNGDRSVEDVIDYARRPRDFSHRE
jgi:hypothetical protein